MMCCTRRARLIKILITRLKIKIVANAVGLTAPTAELLVGDSLNV